MSPLRLAIMTRRFWPYCGPGEISVGELAGAIKNAGHHVEILTVRWQKGWPSKFAYREIEVTRMGRPVIGRWGAYRYLRNLSRHIKDFGLDGIIIYGLQEESWAAIRGLSKQLPVVVRIDHHELNADTKNQFSNRQLTALKSVKRVLVDSRSTAERLSRHNAVAQDMISIVPEAVEVDPSFQRSLSRQGTARIALSEAHPILAIEPVQPLVVCGSPMYGDKGLFDLVDSWPSVLDRFPKARLWILGDGPKGNRVWERIVDLGLTNSVILPGYFDDLSDVFQAADVYVHPLRSDASCGCLVRALAKGTCAVATSTRVTQDLIDKNINGLLTPTSNPPALAEAIKLALNQSDLRDRLGRAARKMTLDRFDIANLVEEYLKPFGETSNVDAQPINQ